MIKLGLRTLEFWVDNLNPDYLYPHMWCVCSLCGFACPSVAFHSEVLNDLMRSLCALVRPLPSPFGHTAMNVLGKFGGAFADVLLWCISRSNHLALQVAIGASFSRSSSST